MSDSLHRAHGASAEAEALLDDAFRDLVGSRATRPGQLGAARARMDRVLAGADG